ncbi:hypothetical protein [Massilia phyllosphaerae]|uniref:hypothetical protein n=1 Tax=Massilia phyllosphaerae TaxID=3106034 RepID=UPI002B1CC412|nr:hypothetical protein [Massilia sp. SGZ-792]
MTSILRAGLAAALYASLIHPACAQWQGSIGPSVRNVTHTETAPGGRRLVKEDGWLPGVALQAGYRSGNITWFGGADWYHGNIDYQGQTQNGAAASSKTATGLAAGRIGAAYALTGDYAVQAAIEVDRWKRDIRGTAAAAGLQESYRSTRLVAGASKAWQPAAGKVSVDAAAVLAAPERLHVGFSGVLDPVAFDTRRSYGVRLGAAMRPAVAPWLEVRGRYDWLKTPRSGDASVTANGQYAGTVAQPEHERKGFTLTVAAVF